MKPAYFLYVTVCISRVHFTCSLEQSYRCSYIADVESLAELSDNTTDTLLRLP